MPRTPKEFYTELTPEKLAERKTKHHTRTELAQLRKILPKKGKILDLACGYGRFTLPLSKLGYSIEGIDLTPKLIQFARKNARKEKLKIIFKVGNMVQLPSPDNSFDAIICM